MESKFSEPRYIPEPYAHQQTLLSTGAADSYSKTSDSSTNDESIHIRCGAANCATNFKDENRDNIQPFRVENSVGLSPCEDCSTSQEDECNSQPTQLFDFAEVLNH